VTISESATRSWVTKACALVDDAPLDYLSVSIPSTRAARSFQEHAKVLVGSKAASIVAGEVWGHFEDIINSAASEGKSEVVIKIFLYRLSAPAGNTTFRTDVAPMGGVTDDEDSGSNNTNMANAMVSVVKELRLSNKDLLGVVQASAGEGWKLAGELLKSSQKLQVENTELQIVLASQQVGEPKDDPMKQLMVKAVTEIIDVAKIKSVMAMQEEAADRARIADSKAAETIKA